MTIKRALMPALVAAVLVGGCEATDSKPEPTMDLVGTSWLAEDIGGRGVIESAPSTLGFAEPGKVAGSGGCNRFFGAVTIDGPSIQFGEMGATMMACSPPAMDQETRYLNALGKAKRFEVKDGMLLIFADGPDPIVRFAKTEAEPK